jgi:hypothetical protein
MVKMDGIVRFRLNLVCRANQSLKEGLIGIVARSLAELDDKRGFRFKVTPEEANDLFEIIDVIGTNGILAIGMLKKFLRGNDHI